MSYERKCGSVAVVVGRLIAALCVSTALAAEQTITINAGEVDRKHSPVEAKLDDAFAGGAIELVDEAGSVVAGQVDGATVRFIEPDLTAGRAKTYTIRPSTKPAGSFAFKDGGGYRDLLFGDVAVWRDMIRFDPADRENTFKPFQHVYAFGAKPGSDDFLTKGPGGKFPHHRGIFFGFKASEDGKDLGDFWHGKDKVTQRHVKYLKEDEFVGPVAARCSAVTDWVGKDEKTAVVRDTRRETTWRIAEDQYVLDYDITLETLTGKPVRIFADPHHGGFHFRAAQEVADTIGADGKPGSAVYTRPATAKDEKNDIWSDCPWATCAFDVKGKRCAVTILDHPSNLKPARFSTRPYGRFGSYFDSTLSPGEPLRLKYRVLLRGASPSNASNQAGDRAEAERSMADYSNVSQITVKR